MGLEDYKIGNPWVSFDIIGGPRGITGEDFRAALVSLKFKDKQGEGEIPKFEMQFDNSSGRILNFATLLIGLKFKIRFGYENLLSRPYDVPIKKVKAAAMGALGRGLKSPMPDVYGVVSMDATSDVQDMHYKPNDDVWKPTSPMPLSRAVKQIARKYGFRERKIFVQEGVTFGNPSEELFDESQIQHEETVREFLFRKAEERGFVFFINNKGEFHWHGDDWMIKPYDTLTYFNGPDILSFAVEGDYTLNLISVQGSAINPRSGAVLSPVISNEPGPTGEVGLAGLGGIPLKRGKLPKHAQPTEIVSSISKKAVQAAARRMANHVKRKWKVKLTVVGNPTIFVGTALNLENFGPVVDGTWFVREVEHVFDDRGYTTIVTASVRKKTPNKVGTPVPVINLQGELVGTGALQSGWGAQTKRKSKNKKPRQKVNP